MPAVSATSNDNPVLAIATDKVAFIILIVIGGRQGSRHR